MGAKIKNKGFHYVRKTISKFEFNRCDIYLREKKGFKTFHENVTVTSKKKYSRK